MQIRSESRILHPRDKVFAAYRDRLSEMTPYIPDIRQIRVVSRREEGGKIYLHNEWISDKDPPAAVSAFLKPEHLRWDDIAVWDDEGVDWSIKTRAFTEVVTCSGRNIFIADGPNATLVKLSGNLIIDLSKLRGVPSFLASRVGPQVEKFIVGLIEPNLKQTNASLQRFLDEKG